MTIIEGALLSNVISSLLDHSARFGVAGVIYYLEARDRAAIGVGSQRVIYK